MNDNIELVVLTKENYQKYKNAIQNFECSRLDKGVEFLRGCQKILEWETDDRIYLVMDTKDNNLIAFFSLKAFAIFFSPNNPPIMKAYPAIKINWFLVDDDYSIDSSTGRGFGAGQMIFYRYLLPTVMKIRNYIGATYLVLFSIPEPKVIQAYQKMGFDLVKNEDGSEDLDVGEYIQCPYEDDCKLLIRCLRPLSDSR